MMNILNNKKRKNNRGFTMAELLIVVAIIGVLAGVSFIGVQAHERNLTQLQYDTIAKEIFVAAQNHLTMAKGENYRLQTDLSTAKSISINNFFGKQGTASADNSNPDIFFFCSKDIPVPGVAEQILPFGAIELVSGGHYIIRYQPEAAHVLDVFYWTDGSNRYDANLSGSNYDLLVGEADKDDDDKTIDKHGNYHDGSKLIGWCGGEGIVKTGKHLESPQIEVINEDMLLVKVTDMNYYSNRDLLPSLKLLITGATSQAKAAIRLTYVSGTPEALAIPDPTTGYRLLSTVDDGSNSVEYTVVLDDITTKDRRFAKINSDNPDIDGVFIPGENITVQAVAYSNKFLTSIEYSGEWTINSLFAEVTETTDAGGNVIAEKVYIDNIRHLENLNDSVSAVAYTNRYFNQSINAIQNSNLDWNEFKSAINTRKGSSNVNIYDASGNATRNDCYLPVSVTSDYRLSYDGQTIVNLGGGETRTENHSIKNIEVNNTNDENYPQGAVPTEITEGGLFGSLTFGEIKNLELIDFNVNLTSGNVGALAGTLTGSAATSKISNVVAYNSDSAGYTGLVTIQTSSGNAGGLIGQTEGTNCNIEKSAAALLVSSTSGNAGGLIGTAEGGTVTACYSGGHTTRGEYTGTVTGDVDGYNVTATDGIAGGLIGVAGSSDKHVTIRNSYSTCSATGKTAGGFVGITYGDMTNCYATGLVRGTEEEEISGVTYQKDGAFAYSLTGTPTKCTYYEIINERADTANGGYKYLTALGKGAEKDGITPLDGSADDYDKFVGGPDAPSDEWLGQGTKEWIPVVEEKTIIKTTVDPITQNSVEEADTEQINLFHDSVLGKYYQNTYPLRTVEQLGATVTETDFVNKHYGDWPAPELFVENEQ